MLLTIRTEKSAIPLLGLPGRAEAAIIALVRRWIDDDRPGWHIHGAALEQRERCQQRENDFHVSHPY